MGAGSLALVLLAMAGSASAQDPRDPHDPWLWPGALPTADVTLQLYPVGRDTTDGHARARYKALALGFAPGQKLGAWSFRLGADRGVCLISGFVVDSAGRVDCDPRSRAADSCAACTLPLDQILLAATGYAEGEPYRLGLISPDGHERVYAEAIPVPLEAASDSLRLHLEMVTPDGLEYAVIGEGFPPGAKIGVDTRSGDRSGTQKMIVPPSGTFRLEVLPQIAGEPTGFTSLTVTAGHRHLTLDWQWGRGALPDR